MCRQRWLKPVRGAVSSSIFPGDINGDGDRDTAQRKLDLLVNFDVPPMRRQRWLKPVWGAVSRSIFPEDNNRVKNQDMAQHET